RYGAIVAAGAISHVLLDRVARLTYHPPDPLPRDWFWLGYHALTLGAAVHLVRTRWPEHKAGILAAALPDFDWVLIWAGRLRPGGRRPEPPARLHQGVLRLAEAVPGVRSLARLPNWTRRRRGSMLEMALCGGLLALIE
ncbi:MAG TPA: hypothetical protein VD886_16465, partial [Herpetosiphonaceae bacterium]|nr:hypothetical protein [Herpetosiphonaceae bacterium]